MSICLVDTSILCEILEIPNRCAHAREITAELARKVEARETLILPMSVIVETGNHVGQNGDGQQRREAARRFVDLVRAALNGDTPFTPTPLVEPQVLLGWLDEFPNWAMRGSGFGDLTILKEFERQCRLQPSRRVYIWSLDGHLRSFRREPDAPGSSRRSRRR